MYVVCLKYITSRSLQLDLIKFKNQKKENKIRKIMKINDYLATILIFFVNMS